MRVLERGTHAYLGDQYLAPYNKIIACIYFIMFDPLLAYGWTWDAIGPFFNVIH